MQTRSLLLDTQAWDLTLDNNGNLATTDNPYAVAQDVACACSTFLGECWYDTRLGIPYFPRILGHWPGTQYLMSVLETEAKKLPYVDTAECLLVAGSDRRVTGVMTLTDTNQQQVKIPL